MATLIPKFDVKNGGSTPTGAINRAINEKLSDIISVKDFGAKGDGSTNDQPAIQAAIAYAETFSIRNIYFPSGDYYVTSGIVFTTNVGIDCASSTIITASNNTFPVVTLAPANYSNAILNIPSIVNGSIGLYLYGTALAQINIANIANSTEGLVLAVDNTNKTCADNVINFTVINGCAKAAIKFAYNATTTSGTLMQGNQIKGNFIVGCKYGVHFYDVNNGSLINLPWDDTEINVYAIDLVNLSGSIGIWGEPTVPPARYIHRSEGYFDAMDFYIKGGGNGGLYKLAFAGLPAYGKNLLTGIGNKIVNASDPNGGMISYLDAVALTTAVNTRASFNGGNPVNGNRFFASITIPVGGLAAGSALQFYFYHPLMTQYNPKITVEQFWGVNLAVLYAIATNTGGVPSPNSTAAYDYQGTISVIAHDATVAAGTYYLFITVSDTNI